MSDIETLRRHLRIDRWLVFGGSWGSTLGLAYAAAHPEACRALVLRGIWLCREIDMDWWFGPIRLIYPEYFQAFIEPIPPAERHDLLGAYLRRLLDPDPAVHLPAAIAWDRYETSCATLLPPAAEPVRANILAMPRIEAHYMHHRCFLRENELLDAVPRFRHVPGVIVHGRYDMLCPVEGALALAAVWPEAALISCRMPDMRRPSPVSVVSSLQRRIASAISRTEAALQDSGCDQCIDHRTVVARHDVNVRLRIVQPLQRCELAEHRSSILLEEHIVIIRARSRCNSMLRKCQATSPISSSSAPLAVCTYTSGCPACDPEP